MLPIEMRIEVERQTQQLQSSINKKLRSEEIFWELNKAQEDLIRDEIDPIYTDGIPANFDLSKVRKIDSIITYGQPLLYNIDASSNMTAVIPTDCMYPLNCEAKRLGDCEVGFSKDIFVKETYQIKLAFPQDTAISEFYRNFTVKIGDTVIFTTVGTNLSTLVSQMEKYELINNTIDSLHLAGYDVHWEKGRYESAPNTFFIYSNVAPGSISLTFASTVVTGVQTVVSSTQYIAVGKQSIPVHVYKPELKRFIEADPYYKADSNNAYMFYDPIRVRIYTDQSGIITSVALDYVRKPRKISLILNQSSELPDVVHQEICDRAVLNIMKYGGNRLYPVVAADKNSGPRNP